MKKFILGIVSGLATVMIVTIIAKIIIKADCQAQLIEQGSHESEYCTVELIGVVRGKK